MMTSSIREFLLMPVRSQLILPPTVLASCIAGCIVRDTRMTDLTEADRVNYFPASPLFTVTLTLAGQIHVAEEIIPLDELRDLPPAPKHLFAKPCTQPHISWNPGPLLAITIAFFPDAWKRLGGQLDGHPPEALRHALSLLEAEPIDGTWPKFWQAMSEQWTNRASGKQLADWAGSGRLKDWTVHLMGQLSETSAGRSLRSAQRRLQSWTGHNRQTLEFFAKVEEVHRLVKEDPNNTPVDLAADAGFADQSHMGRALKRATGFSPMDLNQKIATEEAFWCYRLLGERF